MKTTYMLTRKQLRARIKRLARVLGVPLSEALTIDRYEIDTSTIVGVKLHMARFLLDGD